MLWGGSNGSSFKERFADEVQDTGLASLIPGWYNSICEQVESEKQWRHFEKYALLTAEAPYETGTVTVTNADATVTLIGGTFPTTIAGQIFKGPDGNEYRILSRTSGTELELVTAYIGATAATQAYSIVFNKVAAPSDFEEHMLEALVLQSGSGGSSRISLMSNDAFLDWNPAQARFTSSFPYQYRYREGAIYLWPPPSEALGIDCYYKRTFTRFAAATADATDLETDWPAFLQEVIFLGVVMRGFRYQENDYQAAQFEKDFFMALTKAKAKDGRGVDVGGLQMRRFDEYRRRPYLLPGTLPRRFPGS